LAERKPCKRDGHHERDCSKRQVTRPTGPAQQARRDNRRDSDAVAEDDQQAESGQRTAGERERPGRPQHPGVRLTQRERDEAERDVVKRRQIYGADDAHADEREKRCDQQRALAAQRAQNKGDQCELHRGGARHAEQQSPRGHRHRHGEES